MHSNKFMCDDILFLKNPHDDNILQLIHDLGDV